MYLVKSYPHDNGAGRVHGQSIGKAPSGQHRTRCGLMVAGVPYNGGWEEITCSNCQKVMTGVRRPNSQPIEQLALFDG